MKVRFIGDVHACFDQYLGLIHDIDRSFQVGDFGVGFKPLPNFSVNHKFIRGNHDNPFLVSSIKNYIHDGSLDKSDVSFGNGIFFVGGADSIDKYKRTEGVDWWREEELSIRELSVLIDKYEQYKPLIVVSHDCPESISDCLSRQKNSSATRQAMQTMFEIHQPSLWVFGHWHQTFTKEIRNTEFICIDTLKYIDISF